MKANDTTSSRVWESSSWQGRPRPSSRTQSPSNRWLTTSTRRSGFFKHNNGNHHTRPANPVHHHKLPPLEEPKAIVSTLFPVSTYPLHRFILSLPLFFLFFLLYIPSPSHSWSHLSDLPSPPFPSYTPLCLWPERGQGEHHKSLQLFAAKAGVYCLESPETKRGLINPQGTSPLAIISLASFISHPLLAPAGFLIAWSHTYPNLTHYTSSP